MCRKLDKQHEDCLAMMVKMDKQSEQLTDLQVTVNKISKKLDTCAHIPTISELEDRFVLMKSGSVYYVIRRQERSLYKAIEVKLNKGYTRVPGIDSETIPNSVYLWNAIKDILVKEKKISTHGNTFKLNISESDFIDIVRSTFDQRKSHD